MSAGVCKLCSGAAPVFTGALGEKPEDRVIGVPVVSVHGLSHHVVVCNECTRLIVGAWARTGKDRMASLRQKVLPPPDAVLVCTACGEFHRAEEDHTCHEDIDAPQSE